jgi:methylmalonyl-CoA epimerase
MAELFTGINEIALAVDDIDEAAERLGQALQSKVDPVTTHDEHGIEMKQRGVWVGDTRVALISDATADGTGPVQRFLDKRGQGFYEICLQTSDIQAAIAHLKEHGMRFIDEEPRILRDYPWGNETFSEVHVVFVHPASSYGLLIELQQWIK